MLKFFKNTVQIKLISKGKKPLQIFKNMVQYKHHKNSNSSSTTPIVKLSDDETEILTGACEYRAAAEIIINRGVKNCCRDPR